MSRARERHFAEFVAFLDGLGPVPGFRGASSERIDQLERLAGVALPPLYRDFLLAMGEDAGGIKLGYDGTLRVAHLVEYYEDPDSGRPPAGCVAIGCTGLVSDQLLLDTSAEGSPVCCGWGSERGEVLSDSFAQLLWSSAWARFRFARLPARVALACSWNACGCARVLDEAVGVALTAGLGAAWFSDSQMVCAEAPTGCAILHQRHQSGFAVSIGAQDARTRDSLAQAFKDAMPFLTTAGWTPS